MRWDSLFADLEARFDDLADAELMAQLPDLQRSAVGQVTMMQRCVGAIGTPIGVRVRSGRVCVGDLRSVGPDWLLLGSAGGRETVVAFGAITAVDGLASATGTAPTAVAKRLDLRMALRGIARDRSPVVIGVVGATEGHRGAGTDLSGTIDRVGADFVELAQHAVWEPRRTTAVRATLLVPLAAVDVVIAAPQA